MEMSYIIFLYSSTENTLKGVYCSQISIWQTPKIYVPYLLDNGVYCKPPEFTEVMFWDLLRTVKNRELAAGKLKAEEDLSNPCHFVPALSRCCRCQTKMVLSRGEVWSQQGTSARGVGSAWPLALCSSIILLLQLDENSGNVGGGGEKKMWLLEPVKSELWIHVGLLYLIHNSYFCFPPPQHLTKYLYNL